MVTKRELGIGYLFGAGIALIVSLIAYFWLMEMSLLVTLTGVMIAVTLAAPLPYIGYWLVQSQLPDEFVWRIAQWSAVGLGFSTLLSLLIISVRYYFPGVGLFPSLLVNNIAAGAVLGILFGSVNELRTRYRTERALNQRNQVMNRVLRHNIRNDMNTIRGYADQLTNGSDAVAPAQSAQIIKEKADNTLSLSQAARHIDDLAAERENDPVDIAVMTAECLDQARTAYRDATITTRMPERAGAAVDPLFKVVLRNVVENAIEHNDRRPEVEVSLEVGDREQWVTVRVADNGPGIPQEELDVLREGTETAIQHGTGLGLWLVRWFIDQHDGRLAFESNEPRGSVVTMRLPVTAGSNTLGPVPLVRPGSIPREIVR